MSSHLSSQALSPPAILRDAQVSELGGGNRKRSPEPEGRPRVSACGVGQASLRLARRCPRTLPDVDLAAEPVVQHKAVIRYQQLHGEGAGVGHLGQVHLPGGVRDLGEDVQGQCQPRPSHTEPELRPQRSCPAHTPHTFNRTKLPLGWAPATLFQRTLCKDIKKADMRRTGPVTRRLKVKTFRMSITDICSNSNAFVVS